MAFFENVNDKFFNPFCCKNREIYLECITRLIEKSKEISVLYETDARSCLILYLQNCRYAIEAEDIGEEINSSRTPQENASAILRYFRKCGWITPQEIGRSGDNIAAVPADCRKLVEAVLKIFGGEINGAISNHIFSMYEILRAAFEADSARALRPYSTVLSPLIDNECDLKNELLVLKDSIRTNMRQVMRMTDANSFGQFLIRDELLERFFNDYFFIKKSGLIPSYLSNIDRLLRRLRRSALYERMIAEYGKLKNVEEASARERIDHQLEELDSFINLGYEQEISYIDKKINTYYNLYSVRVMMALGSGSDLEQQLNRLLLCLKDLDEEGRKEALGLLSGAHRLQSVGYISRKSFVRRKKANPNPDGGGLTDEELAPEEKARLTDELLQETPDRYSLENARDYFDRLAGRAESLSVEECRVHTRDDAMMLAAGVIYSGAPGFPYEVELGEGMVETEAASIRRMQIRKTSANAQPERKEKP